MLKDSHYNPEVFQKFLSSENNFKQSYREQDSFTYKAPKDKFLEQNSFPYGKAPALNNFPLVQQDDSIKQNHSFHQVAQDNYIQLEKELQSCQQEIHTLTQQNHQLKLDSEESASLIQDQEKYINELNQKLQYKDQEMEMMVNNYEKSLTKAQASQDLKSPPVQEDLKIRMIQEQHQKQRLEDDIFFKENQIIQLNEKLRTQQMNYENSQEEVKNLGRNLDLYKTELNGYRNNFQNLESQLQEATHKNFLFQNTIEQLQKQNLSMQNVSFKQESELRKLDNDYLTQKQHQALQQNLEEQKNLEIQNLNQTIRELQLNLNQQKQSNDHYQVEFNQFKFMIQKLNQENLDLKSQNQHLLDTINRLSSNQFQNNLFQNQPPVQVQDFDPQQEQYMEDPSQEEPAYQQQAQNQDPYVDARRNKARHLDQMGALLRQDDLNENNQMQPQGRVDYNEPRKIQKNNKNVESMVIQMQMEKKQLEEELLKLEEKKRNVQNMARKRQVEHQIQELNQNIQNIRSQGRNNR